MHPLRVFEMIITPDLEYPLMCTDVGWAAAGGAEPELHLSLVNLNTGTTWEPDGTEMDGMATVVARHNHLSIVNVTQIEKDAILVCYDSEFSFILLDNLQFPQYKILFISKNNLYLLFICFESILLN